MAATAGGRSSSSCLPVSASLQPLTLIMRSENLFYVFVGRDATFV